MHILRKLRRDGSVQRLPELWWRLCSEASSTHDELEGEQLSPERPGERQGQVSSGRLGCAHSLCWGHQTHPARSAIGSMTSPSIAVRVTWMSCAMSYVRHLTWLPGGGKSF